MANSSEAWLNMYCNDREKLQYSVKATGYCGEPV